MSPSWDPGGVHAVAGDPEGKVFRAAVEIRQGIALNVLLGV